MVVCYIVLALLWRAKLADGQEWDWSPAAKHHQAVVEVRCGDRGTSGIYLQHGELRGVLTVAHGLAGETATVTFSDGTRRSGPATIDKYRHDLAWIFVEHPRLSPLRVAEAAPTAGQRVEFVTYGGPQNGRLRHFFAKVTGAEQKMTRYDCPVISGDSGGAILNDGHEVVGVQANASTKLSRPEGWPVYGGAASAGWRPLRDFVGRVRARCREGWCPAPQEPGAGGELLYPPVAPPQISELPKPDSPAPDPEPPSIGLRDASRVDPPAASTPPAIVDRPSTPQAGPPGPAGPAGAPGKPGAAGQRGARGLAGLAGEVAGGGLLGKTVGTALTALGWTAPPSMAVLAGLWLLRWWLARRRSSPPPPHPATPSPPEPESEWLASAKRAMRTGEPVTIRDDPRPPPARVVRDREFVDVEVPSRQLVALQQAMDEYVRRHPGARGVVETIEGYARQYESGLSE